MGFTGGCDCGKVKFTSKNDSEFQFHCQCTNCQKFTGTGHASLLLVPMDSVEISGTVSTYDKRADGDAISQYGFCPNCGSPVFNKSLNHPDIIFFHAGCLDDPSIFKPTSVAWSSSAQKWDYVDEHLKRM